MSSKNHSNEDKFIRKARSWRWSYWLVAVTLAVLWCYAVYEVFSYLMRS